MSDSGRTIGDCVHGRVKSHCPTCLISESYQFEERIRELESEVARLTSTIEGMRADKEPDKKLQQAAAVVREKYWHPELITAEFGSVGILAAAWLAEHPLGGQSGEASS